MEKRAHPHPRGQQWQIGPGMRIVTRDTHSFARSIVNNVRTVEEHRRTLQVFVARHNGCPSSLSTSGFPPGNRTVWDETRPSSPPAPMCRPFTAYHRRSGRPLTPSPVGRELRMTFDAKISSLGGGPVQLHCLVRSGCGMPHAKWVSLVRVQVKTRLKVLVTNTDTTMK